MNLLIKVIPAILLGLLSIAYAEAEEIGAWSFAQSSTPEGAIVHSASLYSSTLIVSGDDSLGYPAIYSIACQAGDSAKWTQWLKLEDALSSRGEIELLAKVDKKIPREENWIVADSKHLLTRENTPDITELRTASTLKLSWNWGWSWLWLADAARFDLGDVEAVIFTLAKSCGIPEP
jgi:hypothetical protein